MVALPVIVGALLLVGSCGQPPQPAATGVPAGPAGVETRLQATWEDVVGSAADHEAANRLSYVRYQKPIVDCMAASGYSYTPPRYQMPSPSRTVTPIDREFPALTPIGDAEGNSVAEFHLPEQPYAERGNPGFTQLSPDRQPQYMAQLDRCLPAAAEYEDLLSGVFDEGLVSDLRAVLADANASAGAELADYASCMKAHGIEVVSPEELPQLVQARFADGLPVDTAEQFQATAVAAEVDCLQAAHAIALTTIDAPLSEFEQTHAEQLSRARSEWAALRAEADAASTTLLALDPLALDPLAGD